MYKTNYFTTASIVDTEVEPVIAAKPKKDKDLQTEQQRDLVKMVDVLFSVGANQNDDVFLKEEILPARSTGAHKPVNMEHEPANIIGHMLRTYITDKKGKKISDEDINESPDNVPNSFDVTSESVLYAFVFPDLVKNIKSQAKKGELFVSVEVWFTDYDYLFGNKIVKRNEETEPVLDPVLRANGGDGVLKGQKVRRVLRHMLIGGKGVVKNPANPESIIKSISRLDEIEDLNVSSIDDSVIINNIIGDINNKILNSVAKNKEEVMMAEPIKEAAKVEEKTEVKSNPEVDAGQKLFEEMKLALESTKKQINDLTVANTDLAKANEDLKKSLEAAKVQSTDVKEVEAKKAEESKAFANEMKALQDKNKELEGRVKAFEVEKLRIERKELLKKELNLEDTLVEQKLNKCMLMNAEQFKDYITEAKSYLEMASKNSAEKIEKSEPVVDPKEAAAEVVNSLKEIDPNIKVETGESSETNDVAVKLKYHLERRNKKWAELKI